MPTEITNPIQRQIELRVGLRLDDAATQPVVVNITTVNTGDAVPSQDYLAQDAVGSIGVGEYNTQTETAAPFYIRNPYPGANTDNRDARGKAFNIQMTSATGASIGTAVRSLVLPTWPRTLVADGFYDGDGLPVNGRRPEWGRRWHTAWTAGAAEPYMAGGMLKMPGAALGTSGPQESSAIFTTFMQPASPDVTYRVKVGGTIGDYSVWSTQQRGLLLQPELGLHFIYDPATIYRQGFGVAFETDGAGSKQYTIYQINDWVIDGTQPNPGPMSDVVYDNGYVDFEFVYDFTHMTMAFYGKGVEIGRWKIKDSSGMFFQRPKIAILTASYHTGELDISEFRVTQNPEDVTVADNTPPLLWYGRSSLGYNPYAAIAETGTQSNDYPFAAYAARIRNPSGGAINWVGQWHSTNGDNNAPLLSSPKGPAVDGNGSDVNFASGARMSSESYSRAGEYRLFVFQGGVQVPGYLWFTWTPNGGYADAAWGYSPTGVPDSTVELP